MPNDSLPDVEDVKEKANERVTLTRRQLWALYIGAATGVIGMLSHLIDLLHEVGLL